MLVRARFGDGKTRMIVLCFHQSRPALSPELREFLDRCVVPALVDKFFEENQ
jgi:hypothetical protein